MNVSRRRYMGEKGGSSPYQRIEYLESSGNQNIILPISGIKADVFFEVSGSVSTVNGAKSKNFIYTPNNFNAYYITGYTATMYATTIGGNPTSGGISIGGGAFHTFAVSTEGKTVDGDFRALNRQISSSYIFHSLNIFGADSIKVAWLNVKVGTNIIYDFIPVRVGQVGYMYDTISGQLFGNAGTGNFTLGPDIN